MQIKLAEISNLIKPPDAFGVLRMDSRHHHMAGLSPHGNKNVGDSKPGILL